MSVLLKRLVAIALSLATIRAQPGGLPGERAVVGATHSSWFSFGLRSYLATEASLRLTSLYAIIPTH